MTQTLERPPIRTALAIPTGGNVLFALAHPDDEFLIGGMADRLCLQGATLHTLTATDGEASNRGNPEGLGKQRRSEAIEALDGYGVLRENQHFLELPDGKLSSKEHPDINRGIIKAEIGRLLVAHDVQIVVTLGQHGYDNHPDHIAVHDAALTAARIHAADNPDLRLFGLTRNDTPLQIVVDATLKLLRLRPHRSQVELDTSDPEYQPVPGSVERLGIRLPRHLPLFNAYNNNMDSERYKNFPLLGAA